MYAGRVACCPLVSHDEYADGRDRQTDGQTVAVRFPLDASSVKSAENRLKFVRLPVE